MTAPARSNTLGMDAYQDLPAMSAGMARNMIERCPLFAWHNSPFNPTFQPKRKREFDLGTAIHLAMLEPELIADRVAIVPFADYRTNEAKAIRDNAYASGRIPVKVTDMPRIERMRDAILGHPIAGGAFKHGAAEVTYTWHDAEFDIPCKARADFVGSALPYLADLKSCFNAHPREWARTAWSNGFFQRAAWYLDGASLVEGHRIEQYWFVNIEVEEPHLLSICELPERAIEWGRRMNRKAVETLRWCIDNDTAPGYRHHATRDRDRPFLVELPTFAEFQLSERDEAGEFQVPKGKRKQVFETGTTFNEPL